MYSKTNFSKKLFLYSISFTPVFLAAANVAEFSGPITFEQAYQIALDRNPRAQLLEAQLEAVEGQVEQAGMKPNPTIGAEIENILGTGSLEGVSRSEVTFSISQLIERGGKRLRRTELATSSKDLIKWEYEDALATLRFEVRQAFSQVLIAQEGVELQRELLSLARESETEVKRRADAARASGIELAQAGLATRQQEFQLRHSERQLIEAKTALAVLWNETSLTNFELSGELELEGSMAELGELRRLIEATPSLARFQVANAAQEAAIDLEKSRAKADYEVFGGARYVREGDDAAFVLGINVPWQIRDRNQGNIRSAVAGLRVLEVKKQLARRDAITSLTISYRDFTSALEEWEGLKNDLLPSAEAALKETQGGYEQGLIPLFNVLDARKALFEIRNSMLKATARYLNAQAEIERLTRPADSLGQLSP